MKVPKYIIVSFILVSILLGCNKTNRQENKTDSKKTEPSNIVKTATVSLLSIKCEMCVSTIKEALKKINGVQNVDVNLQGKIAMVKYDQSSTDLQKIEQAISNTGYDANNVPRNRQAYENLPACCK
jgi:periplasmic mercuric ion binding protein